MSTQHAQYVLLFLVLVINSNQFKILVTRSYSSCPFLLPLGLVYRLEAIGPALLGMYTRHILVTYVFGALKIITSVP